MPGVRLEGRGGSNGTHTSRPARFHLPETVAAGVGWVESRTQPEHLGWFFVGRQRDAKSSLRRGRKLLASPLYREAVSRDASPNRGVEELLYKLRLVVVWGFSLGLNRVSLRLRG